MAITNNALIQYESGQAFHDWEAMEGASRGFESSFAPWSGRSGFDAEIRPFGLATGGDVTPGSGNNNVSVSALSAYLPGTATATADGLVMVAGGDVAVTRASSGPCLITSITVDSAGTLKAVKGTEGSAFVEERGVAGGPALIPETSVEIAQVRTATTAAATIKTTEIFQVVGAHRERYDQPVWQTDPASGAVTFASELPKIHTGNKPKKVMVRGYTPIFAELPRTADFVPADEANSVNSTQIYGGTLGSVSRSLGQASFTQYGANGIDDPIIQAKGERLWVKWFQDRNKQAHSLTQGIIGIARTNPAGDHVNISVTISAEQATQDYSA